MSYPKCPHGNDDPNMDCAACQVEKELDEAREEIIQLKLEINTLKEYILLAHKWGANGIKGYSATNAQIFADFARKVND